MVKIYYPNKICEEYIGDDYDLEADLDFHCMICNSKKKCGLMQLYNEFWRDKIKNFSLTQDEFMQRQGNVM